MVDLSFMAIIMNSETLLSMILRLKEILNMLIFGIIVLIRNEYR